MRTIEHLIAGACVAALPHLLVGRNTSDAPLPPLDTVLKRLVTGAAKESEEERAFQQHYRYTRTEATEYWKSDGSLRKREKKKTVNDPIAPPRRTGALPAAPRMRSPKDTGQNGTVTDTVSDGRGRDFAREDFPLNEELLARFQFTLTGRERVGARSTLVLEFKPANRKLPERNLKDRFINRATGRLWVDEADYIVARVDLHLTERVNVLAGLAGAIWKFSYGFVRERTADGLWFTRTVDWHLEGRELFLRRTVDYHEAKTNVQKVR